jgi:hypothetical protein
VRRVSSDVSRCSNLKINILSQNRRTCESPFGRFLFNFPIKIAMKKSLAVLMFLGGLFALPTCSKSDPNDLDVVGCGDFVVYKIVGDDLVLSIWIDHERVPFSTDFQVFENAAFASFAQIQMKQVCNPAQQLRNVCNDVITGEHCPIATWSLLDGKLSFKVNRVLSEYNCSDSYYVTVLLENATFRKNGSDELRYLHYTEFRYVHVGWCAG